MGQTFNKKPRQEKKQCDLGEKCKHCGKHHQKPEDQPKEHKYVVFFSVKCLGYIFKLRRIRNDKLINVVR